MRSRPARSVRPAHAAEDELLAAVDIGSNSFHMVVARPILGQLRVVDRLRETVRLAEGLDGKGGLSAEARGRAFDCLERFGQRLRPVPRARVRAIATNTVRALRSPQAFLVPAETALGHGIEVVSGREEARLIYLGVAQANPPGARRRLVVDIGGGSTEFIIGEGFTPLERESLQVGCIATTRRFFGDGKLSSRRWNEALTAIGAEFQQFAVPYRARGWEEAFGSSGTAKAIGALAAAAGQGDSDITAEALRGLRAQLLRADRISRIEMPGLEEDRRPIIAGGLLVMEAAFAALGIERMQVSSTAMREGILHDLLGRVTDDDPRESAIAGFGERYGVDTAQGARVEATALRLFDQVAQAWSLSAEDRLMLGWAARLHEIGLAVAHSQYHVHGAYLLEHSDIAGFSRQEQQVLAALVHCQRRKPAVAVLQALPGRMQTGARHLVPLLRLAVLLHRGRDDGALPDPVLEAAGARMTLRLPLRWLENHPLTRADLDTECGLAGRLGFELHLSPD
ncbi:Ppx/GppA phosphatase family protein [Coralloluteibacterium stylophorae]|uniref:Ppx/GppA family phosphatase n=3 Tax=Coralloluteibacterium stylophorae TaxID=1776034 RepID=A0AAP2CH00_9GAMM|nr:Ppx/GppA phosphatase family protein [Coralloluteibacterium stylophorae]MBS7458692.1 Ppx/GppA family phosphatase [Coralloluteibacterium stylophorae]